MPIAILSGREAAEDARLLWSSTAQYAAACSWRAGKALHDHMEAHAFQDWERVFVATDGEAIAGFCTLMQTDCIPDLPYTPYIGFVFVGEPYRGRRLSQQLTDAARLYAHSIGFERVYLISDHVNLYEKYGFIPIDQQPAPWNPSVMETIFLHP